jgi:hypothetical protein
MRRAKHVWSCMILIACALAVAGCGSGGGGGSSTSTSKTSYPELRLANATASSSLVLNAAGLSDTDISFSSGSVEAGGASSYHSTKDQSYTVGVSATDGTLVGSTQTLGLSADTSYTLLGFARLGAVNTFVIYDEQATPSSGFASMTVANVSGDAGTLDVYLVAPNAGLNGVSPAYSSMYAKSTSSAQSITAGTYDIVVTASGKPNDVRLRMSAVTLNSKDMLTLALTCTSGGSLVNGALVHQGGTLTRYPATNARVRVVGAFPASTSGNTVVSVSVGGVSLPNLTAPSASAYNLVGGDTGSYSVKVDGADVAALPAITFHNGGDYTILAYGAPSSPSVAVFTDSNQPSSSGAANLRLVNAAVSGGGLTLSDDYVPINVDVQYGTSSTYSPATGSSSALLTITSPVAAFPTYSASDVSILSSGVYTIFVLGTTASPVIAFAKDR